MVLNTKNTVLSQREIRQSPITDSASSTVERNMPVEPETCERLTDDTGAAKDLKYKSVREVWDKESSAYKIVEGSESLESPDKFDKFYFIIRSKKDKYSDHYFHYVDIKSTILGDTLRKILPGNLGLFNIRDKLSIQRHILYHFLQDIRDYLSNVKDALVHEPLKILLDYITGTFAPLTERLESYLASGDITFDLFWALFKPGSILFTQCEGTKKPRAVKFISGEERQTYKKVVVYSLSCRYLDYDGYELGEASLDVDIPKFREAQKISSLQIYPLDYHPKKERIRQELRASGQKFLDLLGWHHCYCQGVGYEIVRGEIQNIQVNSRIIVDAAMFYNDGNAGTKPRIHKSICEKDLLSFKDLEDDEEEESDSSNWGVLEDPRDLTSEDRLTFAPTVRGFDLSQKKWAYFAVADISEIQWKPGAFNSLHLPTVEKGVIEALANARTAKQSNVIFDDVVEGKGQGLILLLHGPPGVGKTLTAETISEHLKQPLYSVSAGDLPVSAEKLDVELSAIFLRAYRWKAIILLDEADVFFEQRTSGDLVRNAIVSVFLRVLERSRSIIFFTTNRVENFDDAILSRIHLALQFKDLHEWQRRQIWDMFLQRSKTDHGKPSVSPKEVEQLVKMKINGRQIKNTAAIAQALAIQNGRVVTMSDIKQAFDVNADFLRFIGKLERLEGQYYANALEMELPLPALTHEAYIPLK